MINLLLGRRKAFALQKSTKSDRSNLSQFAEMDFHGIADLISADSRPLRVFWVAIIIGSTIFAAYMSYWLLGNVVDHPTVTKIEYLSPDTVKYPTVTICDRGGSYLLNKTKLTEAGMTDNFVNLMLLSGPIWTDSSPKINLLKDPLAQQQFEIWNENFNSTSSDLLAFFLQFQVSCESIFHSCRDPNWEKKNCCQMFIPTIHGHRGICYALKPNFAPLITAPGLFSNFFLKFKSPEDLWGSNPDGIRIFAPEIIIDTGVDQGVERSDSVGIDMGYWAVVKLRITRVTTETRKATPCEQHPQLSYFKDFTFSNCMWERRLFRLMKDKQLLNCTLPITYLTKLGYLRNKVVNDKFVSARECSPNVSFAAIYQPETNGIANVTDQQLLTTTSYWINRLQMSNANPCRLPCDHWEFSYTVERDFEFPKKDFAGITLTILDSQYPHCREVGSFQFVDYVALIGGTWGLWSGASAITIIQMAVHSIRAVYARHRRSK